MLLLTLFCPLKDLKKPFFKEIIKVFFKNLCFASNIHLVYMFNTKYSSDIYLHILSEGIHESCQKYLLCYQYVIHVWSSLIINIFYLHDFFPFLFHVILALDEVIAEVMVSVGVFELYLCSFEISHEQNAVD